MWAGRSYRLTQGRYRWFAWAGFGGRSAARYKLLGYAQFTVARRYLGIGNCDSAGIGKQAGRQNKKRPAPFAGASHFCAQGEVTAQEPICTQFPSAAAKFSSSKPEVGPRNGLPNVVGTELDVFVERPT